ncbi:hypothetical protein L0Y65_06210 [Candidatus Micrarchaeota archaeon]|nr:hypothetical protein [Candidatus Micrarchaeota archaeon]
MRQLFHPAQPDDRNGRSRIRARLSEHFKRWDGPWKGEALLAFRAFHRENGDRIFPPDPASVKYAQRLLSKIEEAAGHVNCRLGGFWRSGVHFIPGNEQIHSMLYEGFVLMDGKGGFSPVVVGPKEILLQRGEQPYAFSYDIHTDLRPHFESAIVPASFF